MTDLEVVAFVLICCQVRTGECNVIGKTGWVPINVIAIYPRVNCDQGLAAAVRSSGIPVCIVVLKLSQSFSNLSTIR